MKVIKSSTFKNTEKQLNFTIFIANHKWFYVHDIGVKIFDI